jgi:hypothetical protein
MSQPKDNHPEKCPCGEITGVPLGDTDCLFAPAGADPFGNLRRPLTQDGMRLSLELARMAYTLELEQWMRAGWTDVSVQVDNQLTTGFRAREDDGIGDRIQAALGSLRLTRARMAIREHNPLSQVTGALRQREESDTIKAVVMARPAGDGRFVLAVGFMGTGARFYDWFSNFRVGTEGGFHKGFYQLTQAFVKNEAQIHFPDTAEALGLEKLTLLDIFSEMRTENSRFSLWMAGHSQGAAVMQVYCDYLLRLKRIPRERIFGCGFASPTVAADNVIEDSEAYPLYHVLNADDLVSRMGALKHLGLCLQYTPDAAFRNAAYGWSQAPENLDARRNAERLTLHITDTPSFLTAFTAFLQVVCEEKSDDAIFGVSEGLLSIAPIDRMFSFAGRKAKHTLLTMIAYMRKTYREICGHDMDETAVDYLKEICRPVVQDMPLKHLLGALYDRLYPPHSLYSSLGNGAYCHIVNECAGQLKPFFWQDDPAAAPYRKYAKSFYRFSGRLPARTAATVRPRARTSQRRRAIQPRR